MSDYVTREELKEVITNLVDKLGDRLDKLMKASDERIRFFEKEQTDRLLAVLDRYERKAGR